METRSKTARSVSLGTLGAAALDKVVVAPTDSGVEPAKFESGSSWTREQLRLLGVDFYMRKPIDLNKVLGVNEKDWSPEAKARTVLYLRS